MTQAQATTSVDDDRVRVTTWVFDPGASTGAHRHEFDYIVVPISGGLFRVSNADGTETERSQQAGRPYAGRAGTEHDLLNATDATVSFVEIELKR